MKRILACLDASPRAGLVLDTACDLAVRLGAKVAVFSAVGLPGDVDREFLAIPPDEVVEKLVTRARASLEARLTGFPKESLLGVFVRIGTPWDAICAEAKAIDADLIVVGSHGYSGLDRILGTTAAKVVNHADRPVLVVRPKPG